MDLQRPVSEIYADMTCVPIYEIPSKFTPDRYQQMRRTNIYEYPNSFIFDSEKEVQHNEEIYKLFDDTSKLSNLVKLILKNCNIDYLPCVELINLKFLNVDGNNITTFDKFKIPNATVLICSNNRLRSTHGLTSSNLIQLDIRNNQIGKFVGDFRSLQQLDCSYNSLRNMDSFVVTNMKSLKYLNCSYNEMIPYVNMYAIQGLIKLNISNCDIVDFTNFYMEHLTWLDISGNDLFSLSKINAVNLQYLDYSFNRSPNITANHYHSLKEIDISGNHITSLSFSMNIEKITARNNKIRVIDNSLNTSHLTSLICDQNPLTDIACDLSELLHLSIINCRVSSLNRALFEKLAYANLSGNLFTTLDTFYAKNI
ncbi:MAG: hypothetical protein KDH96_09195, partial [Candidatus Riesia sp.]|nr:hypothetical protein [Candidatus Riesia sp.]